MQWAFIAEFIRFRGCSGFCVLEKYNCSVNLSFSVELLFRFAVTVLFHIAVHKNDFVSQLSVQ